MIGYEKSKELIFSILDTVKNATDGDPMKHVNLLFHNDNRLIDPYGAELVRSHLIQMIQAGYLFGVVTDNCLRSDGHDEEGIENEALAWPEIFGLTWLGDDLLWELLRPKPKQAKGRRK